MLSTIQSLLPIIVATLGVVFLLLANITYLKDLIQQKISPNPMSWTVWSLCAVIITGIRFTSNGGVSVIVDLVSTALTLAITVLAFRNDAKNKIKISIFDLKRRASPLL